MSELEEAVAVAAESDHHAQLKGLIRQITELHQAAGVEGKFDIDTFHRLHTLSKSLTTFLAAQAATLGECRRETPYAPLQPVIEADGSFRWCCTHSTPHCSP